MGGMEGKWLATIYRMKLPTQLFAMNYKHLTEAEISNIGKITASHKFMTRKRNGFRDFRRARRNLNDDLWEFLCDRNRIRGPILELVMTI
jgi:hypothetical protein